MRGAQDGTVRAAQVFLFVMENLIYVDDNLPGITRRGAGTGFAFYSPDGELIRDRAERNRLNSVALPPAYRDAWFCPASNGHILATGYDDAGRKQYRYHPDFRRMREAEKFDRLLLFGKRLPLLRKRVAHDMATGSIGRDRVIASIVRLLDLAALRIGNESYTRRNDSHGATTLRDGHASLTGETLQLSFTGKSGKNRCVTIEDGALARSVRDMREVPDEHLFAYHDADGEAAPVISGDVNEYLRDAMGSAFSAKDFRTWHASRLALEFLIDTHDTATMTAVTEYVARELGNTPAVTRSSYIHPAVIELVDRQEEWRESLQMLRATRWHQASERALLHLLQETPKSAALLAA